MYGGMNSEVRRLLRLQTPKTDVKDKKDKKKAETFTRLLESGFLGTGELACR